MPESNAKVADPEKDDLTLFPDRFQYQKLCKGVKAKYAVPLRLYLIG